MTTKEALESSTAQPSKNDVTARVVLITGALTDKASYITGASLAADGGKLARQGETKPHRRFSATPEPGSCQPS